jgi:hypothetical protein
VNLPALADATLASSRVRGRAVFVVGGEERRATRVVAALAALPGVAARPRGSRILVEGVPRLVGNHLSGQGGGLSELVSLPTLLAAVRELADEPLVALGEQTGARLVVDWSPGLESSASRSLLAAVYPDARIIDLEHAPALDDASSAAPWLAHELAIQPSAEDLAHARSALEGGTTPPQLPPATATARPYDRSPLRSRVLFVLGAPRSGTTWLSRLIQASPSVTGLRGGETWLFQGARDLWTNAALADWITRDRLAVAIRRFADVLFDAHRQRDAPTATWFVEKTPAHVFRLVELALTHPDAAYVHLVRDGRDVARSMLEADIGETDDIGEAARHWATIVRTVRRDGRLLERFRDVRYEDLVRDPVGGVTDLLSWAGIPVDAPLRSAIAAQAAERVSQHGTTGPVGPGKWRSLPREDRAAIRRAAGDELRRLGYARRGTARR